MKPLQALFSDWVDRQDRDRTYSYQSHSECAFAQFLRETGIARNPWVGGDWWFEGGKDVGPKHLLPKIIAKALVDSGGNQSFGALSDRLLEERLGGEL